MVPKKVFFEPPPFARVKRKKHINGLVSAWRINQKQEEHVVLVGLHERHPVYRMRETLDSEARGGKSMTKLAQRKLTPHITVKASYLDELAKLALQFGEFGLWEIR